MAHATQRFKVKAPKGGSVRFEPVTGTKHPLTNSFYLNREFAEKDLDNDDLDSVKEIEVTVRIVK